jgi:pyruvate formate lyase activating enzyme
MKIVSFIQESFMEYEDYISLVLFSYGCNMKCSYCYNYDFVSNLNNIIDKPVEQIIDENVTSLTDGLVFLGGEPTIYGDLLLSVAEYAKNKYNLSIKLFTNGTRLDVVQKGLEQNLFDLISVDFKSYFSSNDILFDEDWDEYIYGLTDFLCEVDKSKIEVRTTVIPSLERECTLIQKFCERYNIKFIRQEDAKSSYQKLGVI